MFNVSRARGNSFVSVSKSFLISDLIPFVPAALPLLSSGIRQKCSMLGVSSVQKISCSCRYYGCSGVFVFSSPSVFSLFFLFYMFRSIELTVILCECVS